MHDRHGAARARWTELLSENTIFPYGDRRMIQPAGIDGDLVPVANPVGRPDPMRHRVRRRRGNLNCRPIPRTPRVIEIAKRGLRAGKAEKSESKDGNCEYD